MVALDDLAGDGEAEAEADAARGEERLGPALRGLAREALAGVAHLDGELLVAAGVLAHFHGDVRVVGIGLERVEHDLAEGVAQRLVVAADLPGGDILVEGKLSEFLAGMEGVGLVECLDDQVGDLHGFAPLADPFAGEEDHLAGEPRDALHAAGHRAGEGLLKLRVADTVLEELLVCGERDEGIADLVGEVLGHGFHEPQVGRLDLQLAGALVIAHVFEDEQRGIRVRRALCFEGGNLDAEGRVRRVRELILKGCAADAALDGGEDEAAELLREVGEFELRLAGAVAEDEMLRGCVGVEGGEIAADDDAAAAEMAEDVGDHRVVGVELVVQPGVADGEADLLEHVEDERQLFVRVGFAGQPLVEDGDAEQRLAVEDGDGHMRAEELEFLGDLAAGLRLVAARAEDAALAVQVAADARAEREREVLEHALVEADGAAGAQPAVVRRERAVAQDARGFPQEDNRAIHTDDLAQEQEELLQQRAGIEAVREDAGEFPQRLQRAGGIV